jgi:ethanolamine utilization protein EutN
MFLGRVVGCVWATVKHPEYEGIRLLVVQPITADRKNAGKQIICADSTGAGTGDVIYWVRGREAHLPFLPHEPPADAAIVAIVDTIHLAGQERGEPC